LHFPFCFASLKHQIQTNMPSLTKLAAIKEELPHGSMELIAEVTGYTRQQVGNVLNGHTQLNDNNMRIVTMAKYIIRKELAA